MKKKEEGDVNDKNNDYDDDDIDDNGNGNDNNSNNKNDSTSETMSWLDFEINVIIVRCAAFLIYTPKL